jgi:predicted transcriptional regulator
MLKKDGNRTRLTCCISKSTRAEIDRLAAAMNRTQGRTLDIIIKDYTAWKQTQKH